MSKHLAPRTCVLAHTNDPERPRNASTGYLCAGHYLGLEQLIAELPALNSEADRSLTPIRDEWRAPVSIASTAPVPTEKEWAAGRTSSRKVASLSLRPTALPFDEKVSDTQRKVRDLLGSWASVVVEEHPGGLHFPRFGTNPCSVFLLRWLPWIAEQPWIDDFHAEITDARRALRASLAPARSKTIALGPCDGSVAVSCDLDSHEEQMGTCFGIMQAVVRSSDENLPAEIGCTVCGLTKQPSEWRALSKRLRGNADPMLTFAQLSQLHRTPVGTLKRWAQEDQWRRDEQKPRHYHCDDAQASVDRHEKRQEAS